MLNASKIETSGSHDAKLPQWADARGRSVISRAKAGQRDALEELLRDARPRVLALAIRMLRDRDEAEDVAQEVLMKVCRYLGRFEERSAFSTWLHRIAVNATLDRLRRHHEHAPAVVEDEDRPQTPVEAIDEETPEVVMERHETGEVVHEAMDSLSESHRQVIFLREFEDRSYGEIARAARCPVGTVMSRLHHARRRLAETLAEAEPMLQAA